VQKTCSSCRRNPYIPLGTLRYVIFVTPTTRTRIAEPTCAQALRDAGLPESGGSVDRDDNCHRACPRRTATGRGSAGAAGETVPGCFWMRRPPSLDPDFRDGSVSGVPDALAPTATLISIAHRPSVAGFHEARVVFQRRMGSAPGTPGARSRGMISVSGHPGRDTGQKRTGRGTAAAGPDAGRGRYERRVACVGLDAAGVRHLERSGASAFSRRIRRMLRRKRPGNMR